MLDWRDKIAQGNTLILMGDTEGGKRKLSEAAVVAQQEGASDSEAQGMLALKYHIDIDAGELAEYNFVRGIEESVSAGNFPGFSICRAFESYFEKCDKDAFSYRRAVALQGLHMAQRLFGVMAPEAVAWYNRLEKISVALGEGENAAWYRAKRDAIIEHHKDNDDGDIPVELEA